MHIEPTEIVALYTLLLEAWNDRKADEFAALFARASCSSSRVAS
jgi:hypothetical protein